MHPLRNEMSAEKAMVTHHISCVHQDIYDISFPTHAIRDILSAALDRTKSTTKAANIVESGCVTEHSLFMGWFAWGPWGTMTLVGCCPIRGTT